MKVNLLLFDLVKGTRSNYFHRFFASTIKWSRTEIESYQKNKVKEQIEHFYNHSPFFRAKLINANIKPESIIELEDLKLIPPLTRDELKTCFSEMVCENRLKGARFSSSSGTTGNPVKYGKDKDGYGAGLGAGYLLWEIAGWRFSYRQMHIWGNPTSVKKWNKPMSRIKSWLYKKQNVDSTLTNTPEGLFKVVNLIRKFKPDSIDGYTSAIVNLAYFIKQNSITIPKAKIVITTAENLMPTHIDIIEETLGPVADLYGCGEINGIAIRKPNTQNYIILESHIIVETEETEIDGLKEILVTDLDNKLIPLIRYKVGDLIDEVKKPSSKNGINLSYFTKIYGRSVDLIYLPNGRVISPINMLAGTLFRKIGGIDKHKVMWDGNRLVFKFVINSNYSPNKTFDEINEYLKGYEVPFTIEVVSDILPDKNGKYKYFERL
jgi:phenylacetate-CoA ligase